MFDYVTQVRGDGRLAASLKKRSSIIGLAAGALIVCNTGTAAAQGDNSGDAASQGGGDQITVTARRRTETVQKTPVAVTALSGDEITDANVLQLPQLDEFVPNARFTESSGSSGAPALYIRGQGARSTSLFQEPSVGVYVDGVYSPRATANLFSLPDVEQVEVVRGPQGTLFGRNTTGGAILLNTVKPREEAGGSVDLTYASHNDFNIAFVGHTGNLLGSGLKAKLTYQDRDRDGWVQAPGHNESEWGGFLKSKQASLDLLLDASDRLSFRNTISWSRIENDAPWQILFANDGAQAAFDTRVPGSPEPVIGLEPLDKQYRDPRRTRSSEIESWGNTFTVELEVNDSFSLKSISAYRSLNEHLTTTLAGSYVETPVFDFETGTTNVEPFVGHSTTSSPGDAKQFTQELQASGEMGDFDYVIGLFYWDEEVNEGLDVVNGVPGGTFFGPTNVNRRTSRTYGLENQSFAAFGHFGYRPAALDDKLEISAGIRYTTEESSLIYRTSWASIPVGRPVAEDTPDKVKFDNIGFSASLSYEFSENILGYVSANSSYRAGGFNAIAFGSPPFEEETVLNYEAGIKTNWLDGDVKLNLTGFYTDYKDLQLLSFDPVLSSSFVQNVGKATIIGFEAEGIAKLNDYFQIDGNYGYLDPEMKEFESGGVDISDQAKFPYVSNHSFRIGGQFTSEPMDLGTLSLRVDYAYTGEAPAIPVDDGGFGNNFMIGADKNLSARITLSDIAVGTDDIDLKLSLFAENLTNNRYEAYYVSFGSVLGVATASFNRPRVFGARLSAEF